MSNRLSAETSPYLLQHADNPVDWYPWGEEAIERAVAEDKPIFLSIGYSACHWCHVMEHESFEDAQIAAQLNERFVNIKVDREERPDLDQLYMNAVQMLTGRGGWPMSVFLTPDLRPFYGGTYWPPSGRMGMPGFNEVIAAVHDAWVNRREQVSNTAGQLSDGLRSTLRFDLGSAALDEQPLRAAEAALQRVFDHRHGGFGGAPKFPHPMDLRLLLRLWHRQRRDGVLHMVTHTLDKMAAGGIYDHLGGGFHRYSVDEVWLAPHFEKMLYDNALLASCYTEAYQATGNAGYARIVRETLDYVLREMTDPAGGFYSTQDADSEGEEGKFYVWTPGEIEAVLGSEAAATFCYVYDVSDEGNFEGRNILNLPKTIEQCAAIRKRDLNELVQELNGSRTKLLAARNQRIAPGLDDKVLVGWNGLMIDALAAAAAALDELRYLTAATRAADFLLTHLRDEQGRLSHCWRGGTAKIRAFLDDYSCLANGLVTLYQSGFEERFIDEACALADAMLAEFADPQGGRFFFTPADQSTPIARQKDLQDGAVPSGNAMAATALLRLGKLCGNDAYLSAAERILFASAEFAQQHPTAAGQMLLALDFYVGPTYELALLSTSDNGKCTELRKDMQRRFLPRALLAYRPISEPGEQQSAALSRLFQGKVADDQATLYVCQNFTCKQPVRGASSIIAAVDELAAGASTPS